MTILNLIIIFIVITDIYQTIQVSESNIELIYVQRLLLGFTALNGPNDTGL